MSETVALLDHCRHTGVIDEHIKRLTGQGGFDGSFRVLAPAVDDVGGSQLLG